MGNFKPSPKRGGFGRNRSSGYSGGFRDRRSEGRGEGGFRRERSFGGRDRNRFVETAVTCERCGKETTVPFKPTGDKPVLCKECFRGGGSQASPMRRDNNSGNSPDLKQINAKLDKILKILEMIEFEEMPEESEESEEDDDEEDTA